MNALSLFDGISGGSESFAQAGIKVENYYACEINKDSIKVAMDNYPKIKQLGNVENLLSFDIDGNITVHELLINLPKIDILIGGSPCQGLSSANPNRENLKDIRSKLFYNYVAIKNWLIKNNNPNMLFLLENVKPDKQTLTIMNNLMKVKPIIIDSVLFVPQRRIRYYWTNISDTITLPKPKNITIGDIIYNNSYKNFKDERIEKTKKETLNYLKYDLSGKGYFSQQDRAYYLNGTYPTLMKASPSNKLNIWIGGDLYRRSHPVEAERAQGLPDNYTCIISSHQKRLGMIGDGWTIPVIAHILKGIKDEI